MTFVANEWFADDALWEAVYPFLFSEAARAAAAADVDAIAALAGRSSGELLDLCCGPGRHSVTFAKRGFQVTAVDRSPFLLQHAQQYAIAEGVKIRWVESDMREFAEPGRFDLVVNLFTSFGYFQDPADNLRVLTNVRASLARGGAFVLDVFGKETLARVFQPCRVQELPGGDLLVQRARIVDDWSRVQNAWLVIRAGRAQSFHFTVWIYSAGELRSLLGDAGFTEIEMFGNLQGAPYDVDATRLVARARRP